MAGFIEDLLKERRSGPRAAISILLKRCPGSPETLASPARRSGLTRNGLLPRTCWWRNSVSGCCRLSVEVRDDVGDRRSFDSGKELASESLPPLKMTVSMSSS